MRSDWAFGLHHEAHPSAALNSPHYTLGLGIGDQIKHCMRFETMCICVCQLIEVRVCSFCVRDTIFCSRRPLKTIPHYFRHLCARLIVRSKIGRVHAGLTNMHFSLSISCLLSTQAEKEKLQQAGDRNFERILLLAPQQPVPERGG